MPQTSPIGVRIEVATKQALDRAARADFRSTASLINKILTEYIVANGMHLEDEAAEAPLYRRVRGRPKSVPNEGREWIDDQINQGLARNMEYTLEEACIALTGKPLADNVTNFDKAIERALLRTGWAQVENIVSGQRVWLSNDRVKALGL